MNRCPWAGSDELMIKYHDTEWGVSVHNDQKQLEFLILEGAQAGLSWATILHRREEYRKAFANFDPVIVSKYDDATIQELLEHSGIIRNKLKIKSAVNNAQQMLKLQAEYGSFDSFLWGFINNSPIKNSFTTLQEIPASTEVSKAISKALKKNKFTFVGPTIIYSYMQAIGMVNDHLISCFRYEEI
jgi:DNA-3-methyladenine glycosylase I